MVCLRKPYSFKFFKGSLPQILISPLLNTLSIQIKYLDAFRRYYLLLSNWILTVSSIYSIPIFSQTLLHLSVIQRDKKSFREILKHESLDLSLQDIGGNTVLHFIVKMSIQDDQMQFLESLFQSRSMHHIQAQLTDTLFQKKDVKGTPYCIGYVVMFKLKF